MMTSMTMMIMMTLKVSSTEIKIIMTLMVVMITKKMPMSTIMLLQIYL